MRKQQSTLFDLRQTVMSRVLTDPKLPCLKHAQDDGFMCQALSQVLNSDVGLGLSLVEHRVLKHKVGKHCVIEYELRGGGGQRGERVIGKLYRDQRGEKHYRNLSNLWRCSTANGRSLAFPKPFGYVAEIGMVVQEALVGEPLGSLLGSENLETAIASVAKNLANLHSTWVPGLQKREMRDHLQKYCHPGTHHLTAHYREVADIVEGLLSKLLSQTIPETRLSVVHGDLNLGQVLVEGINTAFIDFDGLCYSDRALDVGNFLVALETHVEGRADHLSAVFVDAYLSDQTDDVLGGLDPYRAFAYLRRAMICFRKNQSSQRSEMIQRLLNAATTCLDSPQLIDK